MNLENVQGKLHFFDSSHTINATIEFLVEFI